MNNIIWQSVISPILIFVLRKLAPQWTEKLPDWVQPTAAALLTLIVVVASGGDPTADIAAFTEAVVAMLATLGIVKARDVKKEISNGN